MSGIVYDPAGRTPLPNVNVYVPNAALDPIPDGPRCDPCDPLTGTSVLSGSPIVQTTTDATGRFTLGALNPTPALQWQGDVPAGTGTPLVIQIGKWRRQITIPSVAACTSTEITDTDLLRLPRNQGEGHIPKVALTTGNQDALECLLRKLGVDDAEFTRETDSGRVNFYQGGGGTSSFADGRPITPVHPGGGAPDWWDSLDNLKRYDVILHACEGMAGAFESGGDPMSVKSPQARQALQDYADLGGRVFASHYHVYWFERGTPAFQSIATFVHHNGLPMMYNATIDTSFAKGNLLADWLRSVDGSQTRGILPLSQNAARTTIDAAAPGKSQRWVYAADRSPQVVLYLSASTPVGEANACGRVVVSDLHVSSGGVGSDMPNTPFPAGCVTTILSPQEKVLAFMLFDIGACVTPGAP